MVSVKLAPRAEPVLCPGGAKIKPPFEMGLVTLDRKYSMLDLSMVLEEKAVNSYEGHILVGTEGKNVYTSPSIKKTTEPFREEISINNCKLLTIRYEQDYSYASYACIISDAIFIIDMAWSCL